MSAHVEITIICSACFVSLPTVRTTVRGARGDAERRGWRVSYQADRRAGASNDPNRPDLCPRCRPDKPKADDLLTDGGQP